MLLKLSSVVPRGIVGFLEITELMKVIDELQFSSKFKHRYLVVCLPQYAGDRLRHRGRPTAFFATALLRIFQAKISATHSQKYARS